jgi:hypothetical protein
MKVEKGYEPLAQVLQEALDQAQAGKGKRCHANGLPFLEQPIMTGGRECGPGGLAFQARKKILEALNCKDDDRAIADLLGAINYTAAMVILRREMAEKVSVDKSVEANYPPIPRFIDKTEISSGRTLI